jgi:hypothetical protein
MSLHNLVDARNTRNSTGSERLTVWDPPHRRAQKSPFFGTALYNEEIAGFVTTAGDSWPDISFFDGFGRAVWIGFGSAAGHSLSDERGDKRMRRVVLGIAALAMPVAAATAGVVATAGTAGASAPVSCTKASGNIATTLTLKGCGGGLGKGTGPASLSGGVITWMGKHKGTTTIGNVSITSPGQGACSMGSTEEDLTATVTANTSKADILNTAVSARACVNAQGNISLVKHTTVTL